MDEWFPLATTIRTNEMANPDDKLNSSNEIELQLDEMTKTIKTIELAFEEEGTGTPVTQYRSDVEEPPDNFRIMSDIPDESEILGEPGYLQPNIVCGSYKDVDHYLDVQYRLLREDFISTLKSGIQSIWNKKYIPRQYVQLYEEIRFLHPYPMNGNYCVKLKFSFQKNVLNLDKVNSGDFMFGSLLCFTRDNFTTVKFARIVNSDIRNLRNGELVVEFDKPQPDLSFDHEYCMIQSIVYFEPYFHVLRGLKSIHKGNMPMAEYIVDAQLIRRLPKYLNGHEIYEIDGKEFDISDYSNTTDNSYGFNDSQMKAFKAALTSDFSIIQGPPGTGKTFVALKIAKTLLQNHKYWWKSTPMLVICSTNYALDQFLEGLLEITDSIVRIGGGSKKNSLKDVNLIELRNQHISEQESQKCSNSNSDWDNFQSCKFMKKETLNEFNDIRAKIDQIEKYRGIVSSRCFHHTVFAPDKTLFPTLHGQNIAEWLLEGQEQTEFLRVINAEPNGVTITESTGHLKSLLPNIQCPESTFIITLDDIQEKISELQHNLSMLKNKSKVTESNVSCGGYPFDEIDSNEKSIRALEKLEKYLERRLFHVKMTMKKPEIHIEFDTSDLTSLSHDNRWTLYTYWLKMYWQYLQEQAAISIQRYQKIYKQFKEECNNEDVSLLRGKLVVGITTACAARMRPVLENLQCPIVIVEEAAEILEAHIVTALTEHCRHLILIGDHKQLKPTVADYLIGTNYKLGISLFERMINNGIEYHTLDVQYRMRPEISRLICPVIYPDLKDHESVLNRPPISCIDSCIRFIDHTYPEEPDMDSKSKKNVFEMKFAVALARHLVLNGYKPEQVTILCAYKGQVKLMLNERNRYDRVIRKVSIITVDTYQEEQCDIIILSLVRSNAEGEIGFLAIKNRVFIALSRATLGLYIIGNMRLFSAKSELWFNINNTLKAQNAIGPDLTLRCAIHGQTAVVRSGEEFQGMERGGCNRICKELLACGHLCDLRCHFIDREHRNYRCRQPCLREFCKNNSNHRCMKECHEECGVCTYPVWTKLRCGHERWLECNANISTYKCTQIVIIELSCGHIANKFCHMNANELQCSMLCLSIIHPCKHYCTRNCHINDDPQHTKYECLRLVEKQRSKCSHRSTVPCNTDVDSIECKEPCTVRLKCGHRCGKKCNEPCDPSSCTVIVKKIVRECGHEMFIPCNQEPSNISCTRQCGLTFGCGHRCMKKCNQVCTPCCGGSRHTNKSQYYSRDGR